MLVLLLLPLELPKKILDSYLLLIAEKKYKETHKQDSRFNAPSVTRAITKTMLLLISIEIKNANKIKSGPMQKALAPKSPEDVNNETAGDIQGGHFCSDK